MKKKLLLFIFLSFLIVGLNAANVARIGSTNYTTLSSAFNAVQNGDTIVMLSNVTQTSSISINRAISFVVDGNGKSITRNANITVFNVSAAASITFQNTTFLRGSSATSSSVSYRTFYLQDSQKAKLTLKDCKSSDYNTLHVGSSDTVIVDGGTYSGGYLSYYNYGCLNLNNVISKVTNALVCYNGTDVSTYRNASLTINGGTFTSSSYIVQWNYRKLDILDGNFTSQYGFYNRNTGIASIKGGTFKNNYWFADNYSGGQILIEGAASFTTGTSYNVFTDDLTGITTTDDYYFYPSKDAKGFVETRELKPAVLSYYVADTLYHTADVMTGFLTDIIDLPAGSHYCHWIDSDENIVSINKTCITGDTRFDATGVARIGDQLYCSLSNAFNNANNNDTIFLLLDVTETATINISKSLVFEGNGHTVTRNWNGTLFNVSATASVTFQNTLFAKGSSASTNYSYRTFSLQDYKNAKLTLKNCQSSDYCTLNVGTTDTVNIDGGTFSGTYLTYYNYGNLNIVNGTLSNSYLTYYNYGNTNIDNSTFAGSYLAYYNYGNMNINEIISSANNALVYNNGNNSTYRNAALTINGGTFTSSSYIVRNNYATLNILGGNFNSQYGFNNQNIGKVLIKGGTFKANYYFASNTNGGKISIEDALSFTSGSSSLVFQNDLTGVTTLDDYYFYPSKSAVGHVETRLREPAVLSYYVADTLYQTTNVITGPVTELLELPVGPDHVYTRWLDENGNPVVLNETTISGDTRFDAGEGEAVARIGDVFIGNLESAFSYASNLDTIVLLKDVDQNSTIKISKDISFVFDGDGHTIKNLCAANGNPMFDFTTGASASFQNVKIKTNESTAESSYSTLITMLGKQSASLTLKDCELQDYNIFRIDTSNQVTVDGGSLQAYNSVADTNQGKLHLINGLVSAENDFVTYNLGSIQIDNGILNIDDALIDYNYDTLIVKNGQFDLNYVVYENIGGFVNLQDGKYISDDYIIYYNYNKTAAGEADSSSEPEPTSVRSKVLVNGGTYITEDQWLYDNYGDVEIDNLSATISDNDFIDENYACGNIIIHNATVRADDDLVDSNYGQLVLEAGEYKAGYGIDNYGKLVIGSCHLVCDDDCIYNSSEGKVNVLGLSTFDAPGDSDGAFYSNLDSITVVDGYYFYPSKDAVGHVEVRPVSDHPVMVYYYANGSLYQSSSVEPGPIDSVYVPALPENTLGALPYTYWADENGSLFEAGTFVGDTTNVYAIVENAVARIGGIQYATLQEAFNAVAENDTIHLLCNVDLDTTAVIGNPVAFTFEGHNHSVSINSTDPVFGFTAPANASFQNTTVTQNKNSSDANCFHLPLYTNASLNVMNCDLNSQGSIFYVDSNNTVTVEASRLQAKDAIASYNYGTLHFVNGDYTSDGNDLVTNNYGKLLIDDGYFYISDAVVDYNYDTLIVKNGTFIADYFVYTDYGGYVNIQDGDYQIDDNLIEYLYVENGRNSNVLINNGTYKIESIAFNDNYGGNIHIENGNFTYSSYFFEDNYKDDESGIAPSITIDNGTFLSSNGNTSDFIYSNYGNVNIHCEKIVCGGELIDDNYGPVTLDCGKVICGSDLIEDNYGAPIHIINGDYEYYGYLLEYNTIYNDSVPELTIDNGTFFSAVENGYDGISSNYGTVDIHCEKIVCGGEFIDDNYGPVTLDCGKVICGSDLIEDNYGAPIHIINGDYEYYGYLLEYNTIYNDSVPELTIDNGTFFSAVENDYDGIYENDGVLNIHCQKVVCGDDFISYNYGSATLECEQLYSDYSVVYENYGTAIILGGNYETNGYIIDYNEEDTSMLKILGGTFRSPSSLLYSNDGSVLFDNVNFTSTEDYVIGSNSSTGIIQINSGEYVSEKNYIICGSSSNDGYIILKGGYFKGRDDGISNGSGEVLFDGKVTFETSEDEDGVLYGDTSKITVSPRYVFVPSKDAKGFLQTLPKEPVQVKYFVEDTLWLTEIYYPGETIYDFPTLPTSSHTYDYWMDTTGQRIWNHYDVTTENRIYAHRLPDSVNVTFVDGSNSETVAIANGAAVGGIPTFSSITDPNFYGWHDENMLFYQDTTRVNADVTLTAFYLVGDTVCTFAELKAAVEAEKPVIILCDMIPAEDELEITANTMIAGMNPNCGLYRVSDYLDEVITIYDTVSLTLLGLNVDGKDISSNGQFIYADGYHYAGWNDEIGYDPITKHYKFADVNIIDCNMHNCNISSWSDGSVVGVEDCNLTMVNSSFTNNYSGGSGGVAYFDQSSASRYSYVNDFDDYYNRFVIRNCVLSNNEARSSGGAITLSGSYFWPDTCTNSNGWEDECPDIDGKEVLQHAGLEIWDSEISYNYAGSSSGAIDPNKCLLGLRGNTVISHNTAEGDGGVSYAGSNRGMFLMYENSMLAYNTARRGGAIYCSEYSFQLHDNSKICFNRAIDGGGGAIYLGWSEYLCKISDNASIFGNTATTHSGGIYVGDDLIFESGLIYGNSAGEDANDFYNSRIAGTPNTQIEFPTSFPSRRYDSDTTGRQTIWVDPIPGVATPGYVLVPYLNYYKDEADNRYFNPHTSIIAPMSYILAGGSDVNTVWYGLLLDYDANHGTGENYVAEQAVPENGQMEVDTNMFTYPLHKFLGWNTKADGSGTHFDPADTITFTDHSQILYAEWCDTKTDTLFVTSCTQYEWNGVVYTEAGIYDLYFEDAGDCDSISTLVLTLAATPLQVEITPDSHIACSNTETLLSAVVNSTSENLSYVWSNDETTESITVAPTATTSYSVIVTDEFGCEGKDTVEITVKPAALYMGSEIITVTNDTVCYNNTAALTASSTIGYPQYYIWWDKNMNVLAYDTINTGVSHFNPENQIRDSLYYVTVTNDTTCPVALDSYLNQEWSTEFHMTLDKANQTTGLSCGEGLNFYCDAREVDYGSSGLDFYHTFKAEPGKQVVFNLNQFICPHSQNGLRGPLKMEVYDGETTSSPLLNVFDTYSRTTPYTCTSTSGSLTIRIKHYGVFSSLAQSDEFIWKGTVTTSCMPFAEAHVKIKRPLGKDVITATNDTVCYGNTADLTALSNLAYPQYFNWWNKDHTVLLASDTVYSAGETTHFKPENQISDSIYLVYVYDSLNCPFDTNVYSLSSDFWMTMDKASHFTTIYCGDTLNFYDSAGPEADYSLGNNPVTQNRPSRIHHTFVAEAGKQIVFTMNMFNIGYSASLCIYDGPSINSPLLNVWNARSDKRTQFESFTSTNGALTVEWLLDAEGPHAPGWEATITTDCDFFAESHVTIRKPLNSDVVATSDVVCYDNTAHLTASSNLDYPQYYNWWAKDKTTLLGSDTVYSADEVAHFNPEHQISDSVYYVNVYDSLNCPYDPEAPAYTSTEDINWLEDFNMHPRYDGKTTQLNCGDILNFYDFGGKTGNYIAGMNIIHTFKAPSGGQVVLTLNSVDFPYDCCELSVYDGDDSQLFVDYGMKSYPQTITSTEGTLKIEWFSSFNCSPGAGWEGTVSAVCPIEQLAEAQVTVHPYIAPTNYYSETCQSSEPYSFEIFNNIDVSTAGAYTIDSVLHSAVTGCDSIVTLHLTVNPSYNESETATICQSELPYTWRDTTFQAGTVTGDYVFHRQMANGCDSIVTLHLTVNPAALDMDNLTDYIRCNGGTFSVTPTGNIPEGTLYTWTVADNANVSGQSAQTTPVAAPISQTLTNSSDSKQTVIYTVTPITGECMGDVFTITVEVEPTPVLTLTCPADIYDTLEYGSCAVLIAPEDLGTPTWAHSLGWTLIDIRSNRPADNMYPEGDNIITWTMSDECGNADTCEQHVVVIFPQCPDAVDYEGNVYHGIRIDCDCWTQRNLESHKYSDGTDIPGIYSYISDMYPDSAINAGTFGLLYDWESAIKDGQDNGHGHVQGICPEGWYLPTAEKYDALNEHGAAALKSPDYWIDGGGNNSTGFTSLPGGYYDGSIERYINLMGEAYYWSTTKVNGQWSSSAYTIQHACDSVSGTSTRSGLGYSVRCILEKK